MASQVLTLSVILKAVNLLSGPVRGALQTLEDVDRMAARADGLRHMAGDLDAVGGALQKIGALAMAGGAALGAAAVVSTRAYGELDDALAKVASVVTPSAGTIAEAMQRIKAASLDWSRSHKDSAASFVDTTYMMISAGLDETAAIAATRTAMSVATATMGDHTRAAALVATLYNNIGNKSADLQSEMTRLGDIVTATQQTFQFENLSQLDEGLKYGIPTALQYGVALEQVTGTIGALNNAGLVGSQAGTAFTATLAKMQSASDTLGFQIARTAAGGVDLFGTLRAMEAKFGSISQLTPELQQQFQDTFGLEGVRAVALLMGKMDELEPAFRKVSVSAGAASAAQATIEGSMGPQWQIALNNLRAVQIALGEGIAPIFQRILPPALRVLQVMGQFVEKHAQALGMMTVVGAVAGLAIGGLVVGLGTFAILGAGALRMTAGLTDGAVALRRGWTGATAGLEGGAAMLGLLGQHLRRGTTAASDASRALLEVVRMQRLTNAIEFRGGFFNLLRFQALRARYAVLEKVAALRLWTVAQLRAGGTTLLSLGRLSTYTRAIRSASLGLRAAARSAFLFSTALLTNPVTWIALGIAAAALLIFKYWRPIAGFFRGLGRGLMEGLSPILPMLARMAAPFRPVIALVGQLVGWLGRILKPVQDAEGAGEALGRRWGQALGRVLSLLAGLPLRALEAGQRVMSMLAQGIRDGADGAIAALRSVIQRMRDFLPFSPAKVGPFRDLHRIQIVETIAQTLRPAPLTAAMRAVTMAAALPVLSASPLLAGAPAAGSISGGSSGTGAAPRIEFNYAPVYQVGAGASHDVVEQLRSLGAVQRDEIRRVVQQLVDEAWAQKQRTSLTSGG